MKGKNFNRSLRKHIRLEKARIRREVFNKEEQNKIIEGLYKKLLKTYESKRDIQAGN